MRSPHDLDALAVALAAVADARFEALKVAVETLDGVLLGTRRAREVPSGREREVPCQLYALLVHGGAR
jgi:hypothetical protein